jgi:hypothetical protein
MDDAWEQISPHGLGEAGAHLRWYLLIEAEALLRRRGKIVHVNDWLSLETSPRETLGAEDRISRVAMRAADAVADRLGWTHGPEVLLSVLCLESEPWAASPHGYWVNKEPYDKICLPAYLLDDEAELARAFAHEYAHVVCAGLTNEHAPTWLHEAISVSSEAYVNVDADVADRSKHLTVARWLSDGELELLLEQENPDDVEAIVRGYDQCGWIGRYLSSISAPDQVGRFLREHANEDLLANLLTLFRGEDRASRALRRIYGISTKELFRRAELYMRAS